MSKEDKQHVSIKLSTELVKVIDEIAKKERVTRSQIISQTLAYTFKDEVHTGFNYLSTHERFDKIMAKLDEAQILKIKP